MLQRVNSLLAVAQIRRCCSRPYKCCILFDAHVCYAVTAKVPYCICCNRIRLAPPSHICAKQASYSQTQTAQLYLTFQKRLSTPLSSIPCALHTVQIPTCAKDSLNCQPLRNTPPWPTLPSQISFEDFLPINNTRLHRHCEILSCLVVHASLRGNFRRTIQGPQSTAALYPAITFTSIPFPGFGILITTTEC